MKQEFGPRSNDMRQRRAFAHAKLAKLAKGEVVAGEAQDAIEAAGTSKKSRQSNFGSVLVKASSRGRLEPARQRAVQELRLPTDTSMDGVITELTRLGQRQFAQELGLSPDASPEEIDTAAHTESRRHQGAQEFGLPEDASWTDIKMASAEQLRLRYADELGLPPEAAWSDVAVGFSNR
jgi:hypothetical protein